MNNELANLETNVEVKPATVLFPAYGAFVEAAKGVADYINTVQLTEDNVKEVKKILAESRKISDRMNDQRKQVKNQILADYETFAEQVKEITGIIEGAEKVLRSKVTEMENLERSKKKETVTELFDKRSTFYQISTLLPDNGFSFWWQESFANKTKSMKEIESEIVSFFERTESEINGLKVLNGACLVEYLSNGLNLAEAIATVEKRFEMERKMKFEEENNKDYVPSIAFVVTGAKDITLTEMLLKQNGISFIKQ